MRTAKELEESLLSEAEREELWLRLSTWVFHEEIWDENVEAAKQSDSEPNFLFVDDVSSLARAAGWRLDRDTSSTANGSTKFRLASDPRSPQVTGHRQPVDATPDDAIERRRAKRAAAAEGGKDPWCARILVRLTLLNMHQVWDAQGTQGGDSFARFHECFYRVGWAGESFEHVIADVGIGRAELLNVMRQTPRMVVVGTTVFAPDEGVQLPRDYVEGMLAWADKNRYSPDKAFQFEGRRPEVVEHFQIACREFVRKKHLAWIHAALKHPPYGTPSAEERRQMERRKWELENEQVAHKEDIAAIERRYRQRVERWWHWLEEMERRPDGNGLYPAINDSITLNPFDEQLRERHPLVRPDMRYV